MAGALAGLYRKFVGASLKPDKKGDCLKIKS